MTNQLTMANVSSRRPHLLCGSWTMIGIVLCCSVAFSIGCDPDRATMQSVVLRVTDSRSGRPVMAANVSLKYDYDRNVPASEQEPETHRPTYLWFSALTGKDGQAEIAVRWIMLDRTLGSRPPAWRDQVTGRYYLVQVKRDRAEEAQSLRINNGAAVQGELFAIQVAEIRKPRYLEGE